MEKKITPNWMSNDYIKHARFHVKGKDHWQLIAKHVSLETTKLSSTI